MGFYLSDMRASSSRRSALWLCAIAILLPTAPAAAELSGAAVILHGDTLRLGNTRVHLQGLLSPPRGEVCTDAKGRRHPCGNSAAAMLQKLVGNHNVRCLGTEFTHDGQLRAMCYLGAKNLNGAMVRAGWALPEGRYGRWHESLAEKAKAARAGLWADGSGDHWRWNW